MGNRISIRRKNHIQKMDLYEDEIIQGQPIQFIEPYGTFKSFIIQCDHCGHEMKILG